MTALRDDFVLEEVSDVIMREVIETMRFCDECETQVNEFIQVANCVLKREEYYSLLELFRKFESNFNILQNLVEQIDDPLNALQAMTLTATMKVLKKDFEELVEILELANNRIDDSEIDFTMAKLIQRLLGLEDFDAIQYDNLAAAMDQTFLILKVVDMFDDEYEEEYFPFNLLKVAAFKDKISAYEYALKNGISRDRILNRYGAYLT